MSRLLAALLLVVSVVVATGCSTSAAPSDLLERVEELERRQNAHDIDAVLEMYSEYAHWEFPYRRDFSVERRAFRDLLELEASLDSEIDFRECRQEGYLVRCASSETSRFSEMHGCGEWNSPEVVFTFDQSGLIERVRWGDKDEEAYAELAPVWVAMEMWATEHHPDLYGAMVVPGEGRLRWDAEAGENLLALSRKWIDAGRPHLDEAKEKIAEHLERQARIESGEPLDDEDDEDTGSDVAL
jgi:hypothetical protein